MSYTPFSFFLGGRGVSLPPFTDHSFIFFCGFFWEGDREKKQEKEKVLGFLLKKINKKWFGKKEKSKKKTERRKGERKE